MAISPTTPEIIEAATERKQRGVHTAQLGEIQSYDAATYTCTATLATLVDGQEVEPLEQVPVLIPGAWAAGDSVLLVFSEEDFSGWFETGVVAEAPSKRRNGYYAVAIPFIAREGQSSEFVALSNLVNARFERLETWVDAHVHPTGVGPSGPSSPPLGAGASTAATKQKAR